MDTQRLLPGTAVYGSDDDKIGDIAEVGANYILVQKGWLFTRDIYIPLSAVTRADADGVYLNISKDQVEDMAWDRAPIVETTDRVTRTDVGTTDRVARTDVGTTDRVARTDVGTTDRVARTDVDRTTDRIARTDVDRTTDTTRTDNLRNDDSIRVPIVEEELRVGKRTVEGGGARVTTSVEERPVNEQVSLREEQVRVDRKAVDRPATDADLDAFKEGTVEVRERSEEAVVDKQARVVEEVVIRKDAQERTEDVQDTVRRTNVNVEKLPGQVAGETDVTNTDVTNAIDDTVDNARDKKRRR